MLEFKYDTQLLVEGKNLDEDAVGEIYDIVIEDMDRQSRGLKG